MNSSKKKKEDKNQIIVVVYEVKNKILIRINS